jgi:ABC-2 type transport system permease protein
MTGMARRLAALVRKELQQLRRDPVLLILIVWLYTVEVLLCAYALSFDLRQAPLAVLDRDGTPASRELVGRLERSPYFRVESHAMTGADLTPRLDRDEVVAALEIPAGWSRHVRDGEPTALAILVDGSNAATAATARAYLEGIVARHGLEEGGESAGPPVEARTRVWYNAELKTVYFMVLSMIALAAMMVGVIHPAASLVREKEGGTLEQLLVSPVLAFEIILAKVAVTLLVSLLGLTLSLGLVWWFEVPMRGSLALFYLVSLVFQVSSIGLGAFVATVSRNLQQALLLAFFGLIPVMFLSGTLVPIENMPRPVQIGSLLSPLRYYMDALLGLFLKGNGLEVLWPDLAAMALLGIAILALSVRRLQGQIA